MGFRIWGLGFGTGGLGFEALGFAAWVWGLGFWEGRTGVKVDFLTLRFVKRCFQGFRLMVEASSRFRSGTRSLWALVSRMRTLSVLVSDAGLLAQIAALG